MSVSALVLAGSRGGTDPAAAHAGVLDKALIAFAGQTMLARVIAALRDAGITRIAVSASSEAVRDHARALGVEILPARPGPSASVAAGLSALGAPLLVTTADHALLRAEWVADFLHHVPAGVDIAALMAERRVVERDVPATRRTYLRFADGAWSGCNLFYLADTRASGAIDLWQTIEADRKRPWRIVRKLGPVMLVRYLAGRLSLADAVARLGRMAGVKAATVASPHGLAAVDVDKPADVDLVRAMLENGCGPKGRMPGKGTGN